MPAHSAEDLPMFYACMHFHSINGGRVDLGKLVDKWHSMFPLAAQSMTGITIDGYTSERKKVVLAEALKGCRDGYKAFTVTLDDAKLLVVPSRGVYVEIDAEKAKWSALGYTHTHIHANKKTHTHTHTYTHIHIVVSS